ncbi:tRNA (guanine-N(7)-)-methyltransferase [Halioglobus japonicus]|nr:tRNA (guanine-N(7)-)-methyltransferase [Halioglobus japonicus]
MRLSRRSSEAIKPLHANSSPVSSNQPEIHPRLPEIVNRHLRATHRREVAPHNLAAYEALRERLLEKPRPLVLDSFCGTGHSTAALAERHPEHLVVGIDKSAQRLAKHPFKVCDNYLLLRADCEDIWQLLVRDGLRADFHYIFYPNPWPKARHLQRRVHGHASLPLLLQLGGALELRSNWPLYIEEFDVAMQLAGHSGHVGKLPDSTADMSLFERKYRNSGHQLWVYTVNFTP